MDLEKELLKKQSLTNCRRIVKWVGEDQERFSLLVGLFFKGEYRLTQRAAWPMSYCIQHYPLLAEPHFKIFVNQLSDEKAHPAAKRNIVRLLQFVAIPKKYQGRLMDLCFGFITDPEEAAAVKAFSLHILEKMSDVYPEILSELRTIIEARWEFETPAFRSRARKILKKT